LPFVVIASVLQRLACRYFKMTLDLSTLSPFLLVTLIALFVYSMLCAGLNSKPSRGHRTVRVRRYDTRYRGSNDDQGDDDDYQGNDDDYDT